MTIEIGIIGDYQKGWGSHDEIESSIGHSAAQLGMRVEFTWVPTRDLERREIDLTQFAGLWCSSGSPYRSLNGALMGIKFAREMRVPFLGTCGGCQHALIEIARNCLGVVDAHHAEYDPNASEIFISKLSCSLAGQEMPLALAENSLASKLYGGKKNVTEKYYCNFGLKRSYEDLLKSGNVRISGSDVSQQAIDNPDDSQGRIFELPEHPFFIATLFVPQVASTPEAPHPIITAFLQAAGATESRLVDRLPSRAVSYR
jgi:CTP synthase (UTP-ammonia lyase)